MYKVMIVDDMEIIRIQIKRLKIWGEKSGFVITDEAKDGVEALQKLETNTVDLVIADIKMPKINGIELLEKVIKKNLCPCVVLLSDYTEFNYARKAFTIGAFDYLGKPVDEAEFLKVLEKVNTYLMERKQKEVSLKKLEEIALEKIELYYPTYYIEQIISLVNHGDEEAIEVAEKMFETIIITLNFDLVKISIILKKSLSQILDEVVENNQWIKEFTDINEFKDIEFVKYNEISLMKETLIKNLRKLIDFINQFTHIDENNYNIKLVCKYVLENIDNEISIKTISEKLFINKTHLSDIFRDTLGITLIEYLTMVKMERAKKLIREKNVKNYEISGKLGFKDAEYFSKIFKKYTGMTPTEFKQKTMILY